MAQDWELDFVLGEFEPLDLDSLFSNLLPIGPDPPSLSDPPPQVADSGGSPGSGSSSSAACVADVERFLFADDDEAPAEAEAERIEDGFFAELFGGAAAAGSGSEESEGVGETTRDAASAGAESEDPLSKKRRRMMRNRDSAMKSREKKKIYVKDLEMKSRYLESECQRLDYALQCCVAENLILHQRLQMGRASGAPTAKQESAVLFVESLLLGSLFWLVIIGSLFLVPSLHGPGQDASRLGSGLAQEAVMVQMAPSYRLHPDLKLVLVTMRRRCRGMRPRMKFDLFPLHTAYA